MTDILTQRYLFQEYYLNKQITKNDFNTLSQILEELYFVKFIECKKQIRIHYKDVQNSGIDFLIQILKNHYIIDPATNEISVNRNLFNHIYVIIENYLLQYSFNNHILYAENLKDFQNKIKITL